MSGGRATYLRFQSAVPNRRGTFPGVFALVNGLGRADRLTPPEGAWWRAANRALSELYPDPAVADPTCYDPALNPGARAWFTSPASPERPGRRPPATQSAARSASRAATWTAVRVS